MIDWNKINTVMLDMDGTLLDLNFDNHFWQEFVPQRYAAQHGLTLAAAKQELTPRFKNMQGKLEWYCLDYWSTELQLDIAGLKAELNELIAVLPHVVDFLTTMRQLGKPLWLVTNAHRDSLAVKMEKTKLQVFFDQIICAHDVGLPKEHPDFWVLLQQQQYFDKNTTLFVDDNIAVLHSARVFGIKHLLAVAKPDTQLPPRLIVDYPAIEDFRELLCAV